MVVLVVLVYKSCPTLCDSVACSPPGSSAHGVSQERILEWVVTFFSRRSSHSGIEPMSPALAGRFFTKSPRKPNKWITYD